MFSFLGFLEKLGIAPFSSFCPFAQFDPIAPNRTGRLLTVETRDRVELVSDHTIQSQEGVLRGGALAPFLVILTTLSLVFSSCGLLIPQVPGVDLSCHTEGTASCPSVDSVQAAVDDFASQITSATGSLDYDPDRHLQVDWYEPTHTWQLSDGRRAAGFTTPGRITCRSFQTFIHELEHERYIRQYANGDANHEEGGGPWTEATNEEIARIIRRRAWEAVN